LNVNNVSANIQVARWLAKLFKQGILPNFHLTLFTLKSAIPN